MLISSSSQFLLSFSQMNKLLREVPTMESWISDSSSSFVQVTLDQDFVDAQLNRLTSYIEGWLQEPTMFSNEISALLLFFVHFLFRTFFKLR